MSDLHIRVLLADLKGGGVFPNYNAISGEMGSVYISGK